MSETLQDATQLHLDAHVRILSLTVELCKIFAQDESEKANIEAINAIGHSFNAIESALFYINSEKSYRVCISGTDYPISLPEKRWKEYAIPKNEASQVTRLGSWSIPGIGKKLPSWLSVCLYTSGNENGYVFIGREKGEWSDMDVASLATLKKAIEPVVKIRHERAIETRNRKDAEMLLAKNEERLRNIFEGSRDMIYSTNALDIITSVNMAGATLLGYASMHEMLGKPFSDFVHNPDDRAYFLERITSDGYIDDYEIVFKKYDGTSIFCLETAHTLKDGSGTIIEIQGSIKDISSRIENERKLWKMNLEIAEANLNLQKTQAIMVQHEKLASIGQLAAGVAHEINNPIGFLKSNNMMLEKYFGKIEKYWSEFLASRKPSDMDPSRITMMNKIFTEAKAIFTEGQDGFDRIIKIVGSLKNFSRVDSQAAMTSFDLNAGIESTLVVAWNEIKYVSELRKNLGEIPPIIANGGELNQVILNIIVNAAQAMGNPPREGKGLIEVSTRLEGDNVFLTIHDNGPGIPKDILNKVFDPFFTTKEPGKGTGLGLSISYDIIVNKHGGSIWAESEPGTGTTFFISLPVSGTSGQENTL
jgi:two-component system, NtrC family, sensor kinase